MQVNGHEWLTQDRTHEIHMQWRNRLVGVPWTNFSWGPLVQKIRDGSPGQVKKIATQSFEDTLLLDRSFFNKKN